MNVTLILICLLGADVEVERAVEKMPHCGVAAVYGFARLSGVETSPATIESLILKRSPGAELSALSLKQLREALEDLGLKAQSYQARPADVHVIPTPCIAFVRPERLSRKVDGVGHVIVVTSIVGEMARILDLTESRAPLDVPMSELRESWDGEYLAASQPISSRFRLVSWCVLGGAALFVFYKSVRHGIVNPAPEHVT